MMDKKISDIYYNNIYDFANEQNVFHLQEKNKEIVVNDSPMFSFMMCVYNDMSLFNSAVSSLLKQDFTDWELVILDNSDRNTVAWDIINNAVRADPRIRAYKSEKNVGWAKGASRLLQHIRGKYTTFLAADDCINLGALEWLHQEIVEEEPDIIWVGNLYTRQIKDGEIGYYAENIPPYTVIEKENLSETIIKIISTVYYNSFFHYMRVDFLKEQGIDFFEPYYGDCAGMTKAMVSADKMVILNKPVYLLTMNTSQTAGYYIWGSYDFVFCNQWRCIREVFKRENYKETEKITYVATRILDNLIGNIVTLCRAYCRDRNMCPVQKETEEIIKELESCLGSDEIGEMLQLTGLGYFQKMLDALSYLKVNDTEKYKESWIYPCLMLALRKDELSRDQQLKYLFEWLLQEHNTKCIGFDYCVEMINSLEDSFLIPFYENIQKLSEKYDKLCCL